MAESSNEDPGSENVSRNVMSIHIETGHIVNVRPVRRAGFLRKEEECATIVMEHDHFKLIAAEGTFQMGAMVQVIIGMDVEVDECDDSTR